MPAAPLSGTGPLRSGTPTRAMSDRWAYALAATVVLGALVAWPGPRLVALGLAVGALALRRPLLLCVAAALLASFSAAAATAAASVAVEPGPLAGRIVLVGDPSRSHGATRFVADTPEGPMEVWAWGRAGARLSTRQAGDGVDVRGRIAVPAGNAEWRRHSGVVGRLTVTEVGEVHGAAAHFRIANSLRSVLARGATSLPDDQRALFSGLVLGDDRESSPVIADDFRGAGLTHLLAVSGQNVAFVLLVVQPLVVRLGLWGRWLAILGVLGLFATVTRFEPSVLRATVMAAIAVTVWLGRTAGLGAPVARPGGRGSAAVAAAAGALPGVPAVGGGLGGNPLLGAPPRRAHRRAAAAGTSTGRHRRGAARGCTADHPDLRWHSGGGGAGQPAGGSGSRRRDDVGSDGRSPGGPGRRGVAAGLHLPTRGLLAWIEAVAAGLTDLRLGYLAMTHVVVLGVALSVVSVARRRTAAVVVAWLAAGAVLVTPFLAERDPPAPFPQALAVGWESTLWWTPDSSVLLLGASESSERLLGDIRVAGAERIDLIVASSGGARSASEVAVLRRRYGGSVVWAPAGNRIAGATVPDAGAVATVGGLVVTVEGAGDRLDVRVTAPAAGG